MLSSIDQVRKIVRERLNVCEDTHEFWKQDRDLASIGFRFEDLLSEMIKLKQQILWLETEWRKEVSSRVEAYNYDYDERVKELFRSFVRLGSEIECGAVLPWLEASYPSAEIVQCFKGSLREMRAFLSVDVETEAIDEIQRILPPREILLTQFEDRDLAWLPRGWNEKPADGI